jgi:hypothetical protein
VSEPQKEYPIRFESTQEILEAAKEIVLEAPEEFKESIEPYFVARYFVAVFEARNGQIPFQVWNEYRNALDHLFRHLVNREKQPHDFSQIKKMQNHFLRAALDVLKLHIHRTQDYLKNQKDSHSPRVLELVDNGVFIKEFNRDFRQAEQLFEEAKIHDINLGDNHSKNSSVLSRYLDVAFASERLRQKIDDAAEKIQTAQKQYDAINHSAHNHSFWEAIKIHMLSHFIIVLIGTLGLGSLITLAYQKFYPLFIQWVSSLW